MTDEQLQEWLYYLQRDPDEDQAAMAMLYLVAIGAPAVPHLTPLLTSATAKVRSRVLGVLSGMGSEGEAAAPAVRELLTHADPKVVAEASGVLLRIAPPQPEALENVLRALDSDDPELQREAGYALLSCVYLEKDDPNDPTRQCDKTMAWLLTHGEYLAQRCVRLFTVDDDALRLDYQVGYRVYRFLGANAAKALPALMAEYYRSRNAQVLAAIVGTGVEVSAFIRQLADSEDERDRRNVPYVLSLQEQIQAEQSAAL